MSYLNNSIALVLIVLACLSSRPVSVLGGSVLAPLCSERQVVGAPCSALSTEEYCEHGFDATLELQCEVVAPGECDAGDTPCSGPEEFAVPCAGRLPVPTCSVASVEICTDSYSTEDGALCFLHITSNSTTCVATGVHCDGLPSESPTPTSSSSTSSSATSSSSGTPSVSSTASSSGTSSASATMTESSSVSSSPTTTATTSETSSLSASGSGSPSSTVSVTPSASATATETASASTTASSTLSASGSPSVTVSPTNAPPPAIQLLGDSVITVTACDLLPEPGFIATDSVDGDLTANVTVSGSDDTSVIETILTRTYTVTNSHNLTTTVDRAYIVEEVSDDTLVLPCIPVGDATVSTEVNIHLQSVVGDSCPDAAVVHVIGVPSPRTLQVATCPCVDERDVAFLYASQGSSAGRYQVVRILNATCGASEHFVTLQSDVTLSFNTGPDAVQLIRLPYYTTLNVTDTGSITGYGFDGFTGGVLPIAVESSLQLDGAIDMSEKGFRGGSATRLGVESVNWVVCNLASGGGGGLGGHGCNTEFGCVTTTVAALGGAPDGEGPICGGDGPVHPDGRGGHGGANGGGGGGGGYGYDTNYGGTGFGGGGNGGAKLVNVGEVGGQGTYNYHHAFAKGSGGGGGGASRDSAGGGGGGSPCDSVPIPSLFSGQVIAMGAGAARGAGGGGGGASGDVQCATGGNGGSGLGDGGLGGTANSDSGQAGSAGSDGGTGGGVVYVYTPSVVGSGTIRSDGGTGGSGGTGGNGGVAAGAGGGGGGSQGASGGTVALWETGDGYFRGISVSGGAGGTGGVGGTGGANSGYVWYTVLTVDRCTGVVCFSACRNGGNGEDGDQGLPGFVARLPGTNTTTVRVSQTNEGVPGNSYSYLPVVAEDGSTVSFTTGATNLFPGGSSLSVIAVADIENSGEKTFAVLPTGLGEGGANIEGYPVAFSGNGNCIVFGSTSSNIVSGDDNGCTDLFLHIRSTMETRILGYTTACDPDLSYAPRAASVNHDCTRVAFHSPYDLFSSGVSGLRVYFYDVPSGQTVQQSIGGVPFGARFPMMSGDGKFVAYTEDPSGGCYVHDLEHDATYLISEKDGVPYEALCAAISFDGRYVAFHSNFGLHTTTSFYFLFTRDRSIGIFSMVPTSLGPPGFAYNPICRFSYDGRFLTFETYGQPIPDVIITGFGAYVFDRLFENVQLLSRSSSGLPVYTIGFDLVFSGDGRYAYWTSSDPSFSGSNQSDIQVYRSGVEVQTN